MEARMEKNMENELEAAFTYGGLLLSNKQYIILILIIII